MKKFLFVFMAICMLFSFVGCDNGNGDNPDQDISDPAGTGGNDPTVNNFIGKWTMDGLFVTCEITETGFTTIADIDENREDDEITGTYTLSNDKRTAVASFTLGEEPITVEFVLLEGETDVATMDLSAFPGMGTSTFVKHREGDVDITGTWTNNTYTINITESNFNILGQIGNFSSGTVEKDGNSFILWGSNDFGWTASGLLSKNGKAYVSYIDLSVLEENEDISEVPYVSDVFTKSN